MELTAAQVDRGLVLAELDTYGELEFRRVSATVAICQCRRCGHRARLLPCDVLPHKTYGAAAIEALSAAYSRGVRSLRALAWSQLGNRTPAHTTLHGWTEGFGLYALDRHRRGDDSSAPMSRFVAEAAPRVPEVPSVMRAEVVPNPHRYRSEPRHDRLVAAIRTMALVVLISATTHPHATAECRRLMLLWSASSPFDFPSRVPSTAIEHRDRSASPRSRSSPRRSPDRCPTRTRSPPDDSSTSHS